MKLWPWYAMYASALAAMLVVAFGCTARPMICIPVKLDGAPAFGCVDAKDAAGSKIEPWDGVPAPTLPEPDLRDQSCKGYWKHDGCYKSQKEAHE